RDAYREPRTSEQKRNRRLLRQRPAGAPSADPRIGGRAGDPVPDRDYGVRAQEVLYLRTRPAILYTIVFFILLPIYFFIQPTIKPSVALERERQESLLKLDGGIDAITLSSGPESLRFQKTSDGKQYQLVAPPGKFIPQDLMNAMVQLLQGAKSVEDVSGNANELEEFRLDD